MKYPYLNKALKILAHDCGELAVLLSVKPEKDWDMSGRWEYSALELQAMSLALESEEDFETFIIGEESENARINEEHSVYYLNEFLNEAFETNDYFIDFMQVTDFPTENDTLH